MTVEVKDNKGQMYFDTFDPLGYGLNMNGRTGEKGVL